MTTHDIGCVDERCGHARSMHEDGGGGCKGPGCACGQFRHPRREVVDERTTTGSWHIVKSLREKDPEKKRYGKRKGDYPLWFFVMDRWGFGAIFAALAWLCLKWLAQWMGVPL